MDFSVKFSTIFLLPRVSLRRAAAVPRSAAARRHFLNYCSTYNRASERAQNASITKELPAREEKESGYRRDE